MVEDTGLKLTVFFQYCGVNVFVSLEKYNASIVKNIAGYVGLMIDMFGGHG